MAEDRKIIWTGKSGTKYTYWIEDLDAQFKSEPGNYMFIKETRPKRFKPVYIGETGDLADRLNNLKGHEKWPCAQREGVTHLCTHTNSRGKQARLDEETDLVNNCDPPCNQ